MKMVKAAALADWKLVFSLLLCLMIGGCAGRASMMTREQFQEVRLGEPICEVEVCVGEPYAIHDKGGHTEEYEYIEKVRMGNDAVLEYHYFLLVTDGRVVSKRTATKRPPAFDLIYTDDPYDND